MAFAPAERGKPHPGPWSAVNDGIGLDIHVQLFVPSDFNLPNFFDRLNTVWWITALIRLRGAFRAHVPIIADRAFSEIPENWQKAKMLPIEVLPRQLSAKTALTELSDEDIQWLRNVWISGGRLMDTSTTHHSKTTSRCLRARASCAAISNFCRPKTFLESMSVSIWRWRSRRPPNRETQPGAQPRSLQSLDTSPASRLALGVLKRNLDRRTH